MYFLLHKQYLPDLWVSSLACTAFILLLAFAAQKQWKSKSKSHPLPPGPPRLPIIGNAHLVPKKEPWITFSAWGKDYGEPSCGSGLIAAILRVVGNIVYLSALGKPVVVLNSASAVIDLLDYRGSKYANRLRVYMAEMFAPLISCL